MLATKPCGRRARADDRAMDIAAAASMQVLALNLGGARSALEAAQAAPVPASAPATQHADAILELSAAAQSLLGN